MKDILTRIIQDRSADISRAGLNFGISVPEKRTRPVHPFMQEKGLILEVKRASPSKGDIAPDLDAFLTARAYALSGAKAISCLTEQNYFKGSLEDLMQVCRAADEYENETGKSAPSVLRKDFLLSPEEVEVSYRAGSDAVLLIARILPEEKFLSMALEVVKLGLSALIEIRSDEDLEKLAFVMNKLCVEDKRHFVCGVNSRDLQTFKIDFLKPVMMKDKIARIMGEDAKVIFESGVTSEKTASAVGAMGFTGILMGEAAAKNPEKAGEFVNAYKNAKKPLVKICGLTRPEDALLADRLGAHFLGFIFSDAFPRSVSHDGRLEKILSVLPEIQAKKVAVITETDSETAKKAAELVKNGTLDFLQFHKISYEKIFEKHGELLELPHYFAVSTKVEMDALHSKGEMRVLLDSRVRHENDTMARTCGVTGGSEPALWLAGGITPDNAAELVRHFHPELIDISGGVEDENCIGIKSEKKLKELFKNVR